MSVAPQRATKLFLTLCQVRLLKSSSEGPVSHFLGHLQDSIGLLGHREQTLETEPELGLVPRQAQEALESCIGSVRGQHWGSQPARGTWRVSARQVIN